MAEIRRVPKELRLIAQCGHRKEQCCWDCYQEALHNAKTAGEQEGYARALREAVGQGLCTALGLGKETTPPRLCRDCKWHDIPREPYDARSCGCPKMVYGYYDGDTHDTDGVHIEDDEGWGMEVGDEFGCIHAEPKETNDD
jgi:hypothetical protein